MTEYFRKTILAFSAVAIASLSALAAAIASPSNAGAPAIASSASEEATSTPETSSLLEDDALLFTVGSRAIYWREYRFWLNYLEISYKKSRGLETISDWEFQQDGLPLAESFKRGATNLVCDDAAIEAHATSTGIALTASDLAEQSRAREENIRIYGSNSEYQRIVQSMYGSEEQYRYLAKIDRLSTYLFNQLLGSGGEQCSDDCVESFTQARHLSAVLYIFRSATDTAGHPRTITRRRSDQQLLRRLRSELQSSAAPSKRFFEFMRKFSDDQALNDYPKGRIIAQGSKGQAFDLALANLPVNAYSPIVKAADGYYLILRTPLTPDISVDDSGTTLRRWAAYEGLFKPQVEKWCSELPIQYTADYPRVDVKAQLQ